MSPGFSVEIFQSCKQFKDKEGQQPFFVNSSLTSIRNKLFYILRQLKEMDTSEIKSCQSQSGNVVPYVQAQSSHSEEESTRETCDRRLVLNTRQDMESFDRTVLQCSLDAINPNC